jgi:hypothetical protein
MVTITEIDKESTMELINEFTIPMREVSTDYELDAQDYLPVASKTKTVHGFLATSSPILSIILPSPPTPPSVHTSPSRLIALAGIRPFHHTREGDATAPSYDIITPFGLLAKPCHSFRKAAMVQKTPANPVLKDTSRRHGRPRRRD